MVATVYLNPDGVLHPKPLTFEGRCPPRLSVPGHNLFENAEVLEAILAAFPPCPLVLHSWWIFFLGYRRTLQLFPLPLRCRIVGATLHGNRQAPLRHSFVRPRRDWLRSDLRRRNPAHPILLDSDWRQVLPELSDASLIVEDSAGIAPVHVQAALYELLHCACFETEVGSLSHPENPTLSIWPWADKEITAE
jgi:hypothetical protein